jgi:hypothetical protein
MGAGSAGMIHFVTTRDHAYTVRHLIARLGQGVCRHFTYEELFHQRALPRGTWIFTDHERLSAYELSLAARIAYLLRQGGARILNDPARVARRFDLLTRLKAAGINDFSVWRAESQPRPERYPVFIRNEYDHKARDLRLIQDQAELDGELAALQDSGHPLTGKLVIEYAGEEVSLGVWQRLQTYCIGDAVIAHTNVVDFHWVVKSTKDMERLEAHPQFDRFLAAEQAFIFQNQYAELLRRAFVLAAIDYGRADFALVGGRPQIYEINTNPMHANHATLFKEIHPRRADVQKYSEDAVEAALRQTDTGGDGLIRMERRPRRGRRRRSLLQRLLRIPAPPPVLRRP